jgi:two-component sensor histidine kinase
MTEETTEKTTVSDRKPSRDLPLKAILVCLAGGLGLILVAAISSTWLMNKQIDAGDWIEHTLVVQENGRELEGLVQEMELGLRGYLLSRNPRFLEPYASARAAIGGLLQRLREQVNNNNAQVARLDRIESLIETRKALIDKCLEAAAKDNFEGAALLFNRSIDNRTLREMNTEFEGFIREETLLLAERRATADGLSRLMQGSALTALGGAILTLSFAILLGRRRFLALARKELSLTEENTQLLANIRQRADELAAARDLAEENARRAEALLRDVHHRVGNSLQLVAAFLGLQANQTRSEEAEAALRAARDRVLSIASAQRRLRISESGDAVEAPGFIEAIVEDLRVNLDQSGDVTLETDCEPLELLSKDAVSIGVIVTELVTNAVKYAFPDGMSGRVEISLTSRHGGETFVLSIADDGIGMLDGSSPMSGGLGARIVDRLSAALGGEVERIETYPKAERPGSRISIIFPNPRLI